MKKSILTITAFLGLIAITSSFSCRKKDNNPAATGTTSTTTQQGTLVFHLHTAIDTSEVSLGQVVKNADGRNMSLKVAELYISNISAIKKDGSSVSFPGIYILKNVDTEQYVISSIPAGNYTTVSFTVGLDSITNHKDPSAYSFGSALAPHTPSMWFGTGAKGYIFVNVQGLIDSSISKSGTANYPFSYQLGSDALKKTITMPAKAFAIVPGQVQEVHMVIDYAYLMHGLSLATENRNGTYDNTSLAARIAANIPGMFSYEK